MKKSVFFIQACGLALFTFGNVYAATIIGATGSGTAADPYILTSSSATITNTPSVDPVDKTWVDQFYFNFQPSGANTLNLDSMTSSPEGVNFGNENPGDPGGLVYKSGDNPSTDAPLGQIDDIVDGIRTGNFNFHDVNGLGGDLLLPVSSSGYFLQVAGNADGNSIQGPFSYSISLSGIPVSQVPVPGAFLLMLSGIIGFLGIKNSKNCNFR